MSICPIARRTVFVPTLSNLSILSILAALVLCGAPAASAQAEPAEPAVTESAQAPPAPADPKAAAIIEKARQDAEEAAARGSIAAPETGNEPPDGVWLLDEQGAEYYIEKMKRYEGRYKWLGEKRIKYLGVPLDIVDDDADWFYVKVYRTGARPVVVKTPPPTPEVLAEVAASYQSDTRTADRLELIPFDEGLPRSGQWRNGFEIADMNGDGHPDIVHGPPRKGVRWPVIFLGDGAGGWRVWQDLRFPASYDYGDVAVGDYNGDGLPDLALGIHLRGLRVLVAAGDGSFKDWSEGIGYQVPGEGGTGDGFSSRSIVAVDWNHDGRQDILALGEGPRMGGGSRPSAPGSLFIADGPAIFLNQGNGRWHKLARISDANQLFGDDLALGDFNGDGRTDFATASSRMGRRDLLNLSGEGSEWTATDLSLLRPNLYVRSVTAADFDGDGRDDLAVAYVAFEASLWHNGIDIFYSQEDGSWRRRGLVAREGNDAIYSVGHGDLDGDGALDLAAVDGEGNVLLFLGDGHGFFAAEETPEASQPRGRCRGYHVELADLDGDGRDEIVTSFADEANAYLDPDRCPSGGGMMAWKARQSGQEEKKPPAAP